MILVLFELDPSPDGRDTYFDLAAALKPELETIDGFISIERFESLATPGRYLSLSVWRDEAAIQTWRNRPGHRQAQAAGRAGVLSHYRLRIAEVIRDYGLNERGEAPPDSRAWHG